MADTSGDAEFWIDDDLNFNDPTIFSQLDEVSADPKRIAARSTASILPRSLVQPPRKFSPAVAAPPAVKYPPTILRPPKPPPNKKQRVASPAPTPTAPVPAATPPSNVVPRGNPRANVFARREVVVQPRVERGGRSLKVEPVDEREEAEMPEITIEEDGGYGRQESNVEKAFSQWGGRGAGGAPARGRETAHAETSGLSDAERRELKALREEKEKLSRNLQELQSKVEEDRHSLIQKAGEVSLVRGKLNKSENEYKLLKEAEARTRKELQDTLASKVAEYRKEVERLQVEASFRRHEMETSASAVRKPTGSQWSSTNRPRTGSMIRGGYGNMGPPPLPINFPSPSLGRSQRGGSALPPAKLPRNPAPPAPLFKGFKNAFSPSDRPVGNRPLQTSPSNTRAGPHSPRDGTSPSQKRLSTKESPNRGRTSVERDGKGKGKMMMDDGTGDDGGMMDWADQNGNEGVDMSMMEMDENDNSREEDDGFFPNQDERDWRGEILSVVFSHSILVPFDAESSITPHPTPTTQRSSSMNTATSSHSFSTSRPSTSNFAHSSTSTSRPLAPPADAASPPPDPTPIPTFHYLTNLRFPPGTPPTLVQDYEAACRDLFATLGKRAGGNRFNGGENDFDEGLVLAVGLGEGLAALAELLESAAIVGPLIGVLSLLSSLILVFPVFALYFLDDAQISRARVPSKFLLLLAKIIKRFGRPSPAVRVVDKGNRGKAKERSRRVRGVVLRAAVVPARDEDERVDLDVQKREALLFVVTEILEGLAWRMPERVEENFTPFLEAQDAVGILLELKQPPTLLTRVVRILSLLACRPRLFRPLVSVKISDSRTAVGVSLLDRVGVLLSLGSGSTGPKPEMFTLDQALLTLFTTLATKHEDSITLLSSSATLIPELMGKLSADVQTIWECDGQDITEAAMDRLCLVVDRILVTVQLFYYLTCSPTSTLKLAQLFARSTTYKGLHDLFNGTFGRLAYANPPDWVKDTPQDATLINLATLAAEIMDGVSPSELEEIQSCFTTAVEEQPEDDELGLGEEEDDEIVMMEQEGME